MNMQNKKVVLVAAIGTSPAVLTETVWAMAHGRDAVIPDEIEVVTTLAGKNRSKNSCFPVSHPSGTQ